MKILHKGIILSLFLSLSSVYADVSPETMVNVFERLETLETKARELNGENEVLRHQLKELKKRQKEGFINIDERIDEISNASDSSEDKKAKSAEVESKDEPSEPEKKESEKATSETNTEKAPATKEIEETKEVPKKTSTEASTATPNKNKKIRMPNSYESETYKSAFSLMKTSPTAATKAFQEYIQMQPESPLAANAQYWIGEIMYSHNNYKGAVEEFIKVLQKYKYSDKAPDAAIKLGYSFYALKNWAYAKRTFEDVIKYFPENKNAVNLANRRLAKIKAAGH
ncbi:MAG: tol-pal system protein YbgF [Cocleimonas sp.]|nr:tol-pal system protein YbgF [Cocleimonas sp.]